MRPNSKFGSYIPDKTVNKAIAAYQDAQPQRIRAFATPSTLTECPRVIWLRKHGVEPTNVLGWGKKQRFELGRITERLIAKQLDQAGLLLHWWADEKEGDSEPFSHGQDLDKLVGTPDLLLQLHKVAISDAKTSRSDSFRYVPILPADIWKDPYWHKYKLQLTAYFLLCHWNKAWFEANNLPLPEICHLFSYALDDGIVRREVTWVPTKTDVARVLKLTRRWNEAYASESCPDCTCVEDGNVKFCPMGIMEKGDKVCKSCCSSKLLKQVK